MTRRSRVLRFAAVALAVTAAAGLFVAAKTPASTIAADDLTKILDQAEAAARKEESLLRVNAEGKKQPTRMHIVILDRGGRLVGQRSMPDAWLGSINIARAKAFTSVAFSSNENALTTRTLGPLTQPGGPLWNIGNSNRQDGIIEFPGGVPLYKGSELIGAIGVSGDGVDQDERVAVAGAAGFEAPKAIRVDTVTNNGVPYIK
ncbi:MAG TPA: heme-binding protein [Planctomycetota bacterium]|nr:heme-binding protein [Planctomycetota bacterium]